MCNISQNGTPIRYKSRLGPDHILQIVFFFSIPLIYTLIIVHHHFKYYVTPSFIASVQEIKCSKYIII